MATRAYQAYYEPRLQRFGYHEAVHLLYDLGDLARSKHTGLKGVVWGTRDTSEHSHCKGRVSYNIFISIKCASPRDSPLAPLARIGYRFTACYYQLFTFLTIDCLRMYRTRWPLKAPGLPLAVPCLLL